MRSITSALALAALLLAPTALAAETAPLSVAVLDFKSPKSTPELGAEVAAILAAHLSVADNLFLVERSDIDAILGESELSLSGTVDPATAPQIGQLVGAQVLVTGRVVPAGKSHLAVAKLISTQNGRVLAAKAKIDTAGDLSDQIESLAENLTATLAEKGDQLLPTTETAAGRLERLKKLVAGRDLPSVYVSIPETHISRPVPDPAAQTEIELTFQQLGAKLADTPANADVTITGEAFSERAGTVGNLTTCRARLEVKMTKKSAPDRKWVARRTVGAVDLAENTAAKSALQKAGASAAEQILTLLLQ